MKLAFERHVAGSPQVEEHALTESIRRSVALARGGTFVVGMAIVALATRVMGLGVGGTLCVVIGLLPIVGAVSWFAGMGAIMKGVRQRADFESKGPTLKREKVTVEVTPDALEVTAFDTRQRWPWAEVKHQRTAVGLRLSRGDQEIEVPISAFQEPVTLDAFLAELQKRHEKT